MAFTPAETSVEGVTPDVSIVVCNGMLLCEKEQSWRPLASCEVAEMITPILSSHEQQHYLGSLDGKHCDVLFYHRQELPVIDGFQWNDLRSQLLVLEEELFQLAGRALQITRWYRDHQFCGRCGKKTRESSNDRALVCDSCNLFFYPRISPCVIGLVKKGKQCLLAQGVKHPEGLYSTLAGFIEPGETAEQAFAREVYEEVGIEIGNVRYFSTQPWPFPGQLMIAYTADYVAGEINIDDDEIVDAQWFDVDALPFTPPPSTIAGKLIQEFIAQTKG